MKKQIKKQPRAIYLYQYRIQIGNYPHSIVFFRASAPIYKTRDQAEIAAFDYLTLTRGLKPGDVSRKWIHSYKVRINSKYKQPKRAHNAFINSARPEFAMFDWKIDQDGFPIKRIWDEKVIEANHGQRR